MRELHKNLIINRTMTPEEIRKKMREGASKLDPIVMNMNRLVLDSYEAGFRTCWELLTGQKL